VCKAIPRLDFIDLGYGIDIVSVLVPAILDAPLGRYAVDLACVEKPLVGIGEYIHNRFMALIN